MRNNSPWEAYANYGEALAFLKKLPDSEDTKKKQLGLIHLKLGEHDAALNQVETLLAIPSRVSPNLLWLDPRQQWPKPALAACPIMECC